MKVPAYLGVWPLGFSDLNKPISSPTTPLLWPARKAVWLVIFLMVTPDYSLFSFQSICRQRDMDCRHDSRNIHSMFGRNIGFQSDEAIYSSCHTDLPRPPRWILQKRNMASWADFVHQIQVFHLKELLWESVHWPGSIRPGVLGSF